MRNICNRNGMGNCAMWNNNTRKGMEHVEMSINYTRNGKLINVEQLRMLLCELTNVPNGTGWEKLKCVTTTLGTGN